MIVLNYNNVEYEMSERNKDVLENAGIIEEIGSDEYQVVKNVPLLAPSDVVAVVDALLRLGED